MKKRAFATLLSVLMLLTSLSLGAATAQAEGTVLGQTDIDKQVSLISSQIASLKQPVTQNQWYYTVTDLNHDGKLEFVAASQHPADRSVNLRVWEVNDAKTGLTEAALKKDPNESFPDIMTDALDTFHDTASNIWYYLFYDNVIISPTEIYTIKTAFRMTGGVIDYYPYAIEHTVVKNGVREVSYTDAAGAVISQQQYNAAGVNAFTNMARSNTRFQWLTADKLNDVHNLTNSYAVFAGMMAPTEIFPVPRPEALTAPAATAAPAATPAPVAKSTQPVYLNITKNPTNESKNPGSTALFVSCANAFDSLYWTMVSPDGGEYTTQSFAYLFPGSSVTGVSSTTLSIANVSADMSGWGAYCTFNYKGQTARTTTAYLTVAAQKYVPTPTNGVFYGTVSDWNYGYVSVYVDASTVLAIDWADCTLTGDIYVGAPAAVYWDGTTTKGVNVVWCDITGSQYEPEISYGSMSGTAYHDGGNYVYVSLANGQSFSVSSWICNVLEGTFIDGCSCTVYYTDYPSADNIYDVDIYGVYDVDYDYEWDIYDYIYDYDYDFDYDYDYDWDYIPEYVIEYEPDYDWYNYDFTDYDPIGDEINRVACPVCGNHFSMGEYCCPYCGYEP